jgi:hypothetical protein
MYMVVQKATLDDDWERLLEMEKDKLIGLLFLHIRDVWTEDGLYYLGIEKRFCTEVATEIDQEVWGVMGKVQARRLIEVLNIKDKGITGLYQALKYTDWWLDMEEKEYEVNDDRLRITNRKCRVHIARKKKGLDEFNCKQVRWGMLKNFVKEFNPNIKVDCHFCPKDPHPEDAWCEWEFVLNKR